MPAPQALMIMYGSYSFLLIYIMHAYVVYIEQLQERVC